MPTSTSSGLLCSAGEWLMPPRLGMKSMAAGTWRPITIASWPAPLAMRRRVAPAATAARSSTPTSDGVELERLERERLLEGRLETLFRRDRRHGLLDEVLDLGKRRAIRRAHVDREVGEARNDIRATRLDVDLPDVCRHPLSPTRFLAESERDSRGTDERVAAGVHRRRAGMIRLAQQPNAVAPETHDRRHESQLEPLRFEDGALLDVQLEV